MSQSIDFDIAPQAIESALHEWSRQSSVQVMVASDDVSGVHSDGVKDRLTAGNALAQILKPTKLTYETVGDNTVTVKQIAETTTTGSKEEASDSSGSENRMGTSANVRDIDSTSSKGRRTIEEVVVSAQRREELLKDVPISITALSGDELDRSTMEGVSEALTTVPGVAALEWRNGMGRQLSVRGVTAITPTFTGASPIGYYVDSTPFSFVRSSFAPDAGAYDLERVEVLRGPQGTLYGASSLNGVVRILTKEPDVDKFSFKSRVLGSTTEEGSGNYRGDMAINVPLIERKLAARLTAGYEDMSGWIDKPNFGATIASGSVLNNGILKRNVNDAQIDTVRLKIRAQPTEELTADVSAWRYRSDYGSGNTGDDNSTHASSFAEPNSTDYDVYGLKLSYEFPAFALTSSSSYMDFISYGELDFSPFCCVPFRSFTDFTAHFFTQEINASSTADGPWQWSLGAFYRSTSNRSAQGAVSNGIPTTDYVDTSESWAVFGELSRLLLDGRLELTAGLRYFEDRIGTETRFYNILGPGVRPSASDDFDSLTPRFVVTGHVNEDFLVYASYSEGFRSGLLPAPPAAAQGIPPAQPDTLKNYEVGTKVTLWDNRLSMDAAVYYMDWKDTLVGGPTVFLIVNGVGRPFGASIVNGPTRSGMGVDLAVAAYPTDGLTLGFNLSVNDLKPEGKKPEEEKRSDSSPAATYGVFADYQFPLWRFTGTFSASANYVSGSNVRSVVASGIVYESDPQLISRASFAVRAPSNWVATAFVNNLNNEQGVAAANAFATPSWDARTRPRTYGVQLEYSY